MSARADMLSKVEGAIKIELSFPVCLSAFLKKIKKIKSIFSSLLCARGEYEIPS